MSFTRVAGAVLGILVVVFVAGWLGNLAGDRWGESVGGYLAYTVIVLAALAVAVALLVQLRRRREGPQ